MSDTVKLIIEIPKETKQAFDKAESNDLKDGYYDHGGIIGKAIQNGIPLDNVKAEIQAKEMVETEVAREFYNMALGDVIEILDNIGKAESENE